MSLPSSRGFPMHSTSYQQ